MGFGFPLFHQQGRKIERRRKPPTFKKRFPYLHGKIDVFSKKEINFADYIFFLHIVILSEPFYGKEACFDEF